MKNLSKSSKGFTLIELLIVIAVLGILAAVVLVEFDPVQQLARGRDAGRKTSIGQLGRALQAYYTVRSQYLTSAEWTTAPNQLVSAGEIQAFPANPAYSGAFACTTPTVFQGYCYNTGLVAGTPQAVVYARLESNSENSKCAPNIAWFAFATNQGRAGIVCTPAADPSLTPTFLP